MNKFNALISGAAFLLALVSGPVTAGHSSFATAPSAGTAAAPDDSADQDRL